MGCMTSRRSHLYRFGQAILIATSIVLSWATGAVAVAQDVNLAGLIDGFEIYHRNVALSSYRRQLSGIGDFNGDGLADLVIGIADEDPDPLGIDRPGVSYIVFGRTSSAPINLSSLAENGIQLNGAFDGGRFGYSVAGAGDVNGDGLADLLVSAPETASGPVQDGEAYVIFGRQDGGVIEMDELGLAGIRLKGTLIAGNVGDDLSGAGDINGDGYSDLIIGTRKSKAYVVFGSPIPGEIELESLGTHGFEIRSNPAINILASAVSGVGDFNGDGLPDLALLQFHPEPAQVIVVFGRPRR